MRALLVALMLVPQAPHHIHQSRLFALDLPAGWRQMTPDEARQIKLQHPKLLDPDLVEARPAAFYPYGPVDRWLAGDFTGHCLTIARIEGEVPCDDSGLAAIREHVLRSSTDQSWSREMLAARIASIGAAKHPAIECLTRTKAADRPAFEALELCVPTGGDTIVLSLRAPATDFAAALPGFQQTAASIVFARPPKGTPKLTDRLFYPAVVGLLVAVLLLVLRRKAATA